MEFLVVLFPRYSCYSDCLTVQLILVLSLICEMVLTLRRSYHSHGLIIHTVLPFTRSYHAHGLITHTVLSFTWSYFWNCIDIVLWGWLFMSRQITPSHMWVRYTVLYLFFEYTMIYWITQFRLQKCLVLVTTYMSLYCKRYKIILS